MSQKKKKILKRNENLIIKTAAKVRNQTVTPKPGIPTGTVICADIRHSPEHHIPAPLSPGMIPEGSCQLQETGEKAKTAISIN